MQGRRVFEEAPGHIPSLLDGDYVMITDLRDGIPYWYAKTPNGYQCNLRNHKIEEHADGTITVSPSILVSTAKPDPGGILTSYQVWHGFLEKGKWREA